MPAHNLEANEHAPGFVDPGVVRFFGDAEFDRAYPEPIRKFSPGQWTPFEVGRKAAQFLVTERGTRVLDIGCGPGKFCAIGAVTTEGHFTGIEQRRRLVTAGSAMLRAYRIPRVKIIHANVKDIGFEAYDAFYIFNPFQENVLPSHSIDSDVELLPELYTAYAAYVRSHLSSAPLGTRVATYWGDDDEVPSSYDCMETSFDGQLKFWCKGSRLSVAGINDDEVPQHQHDHLAVGACGLSLT